MLEKYYTVYDMSTLDDGQSHITVGIAKANSVDTIGDELLGKIKTEQLYVVIICALIIILIITVAVCVWKYQSRFEITERQFEEYETKEVRRSKHVGLNDSETEFDSSRDTSF